MEKIYATKINPCPICGKEDWCCFIPSDQSVCLEDGLYICNRSQTKADIISPINGSIYLYRKDTINGDGIYIKEEVQQQKREDRKSSKNVSKPIIKRKEEAKGNIARANKELDYIYRKFLSMLTLKQQHKKILLEEGWSEELITRSLFCSIPEYKPYYVKELLKSEELKGVPGFYYSKEHWSFVGKSGILMPLYDIKNQIFRLRIRDDNPELDDKGKEKNKYKNFASHGIGGCQAGLQIGIIQKEGNRKEEFYITEGEKKALVGNYCLNRRVVNLTGVNCFRFLLEANGSEEAMLSYLIKTGAKIPIVAFDADKRDNPAVWKAHNKLIQLLKGYFQIVGVANWNSGFGKGLDDILLTGILPNIIYV